MTENEVKQLCAALLDEKLTDEVKQLLEEHFLLYGMQGIEVVWRSDKNDIEIMLTVPENAVIKPSKE